jgi:proline iminopeptidase
VANDRLAVRETYVKTGDARLFVRVVGEGPTVVVLHGGPDFGFSYLLPGLDRLAAVCRLVYYDQRGRGRSADGIEPADVTIGSEVEDLDAVREWLGLDAVAVMGHSWGGLLAMEYAIRRPRRVSHLILMNTAPASHTGMLRLRRSLAESKKRAQAEEIGAISRSAAYLAGDREADAAYYRIHFGTTLASPALMEQLIGNLRTGSTAAGIVLGREIERRLYGQTWAREDYDLVPQLERLHLPALVLHGDRDFVPVEIAEQLAAALAGSLVVLDECGHFAYMEQPDQVRLYVRAFLAR